MIIFQILKKLGIICYHVLSKFEVIDENLKCSKMKEIRFIQFSTAVRCIKAQFRFSNTKKLEYIAVI